MAISKKNKRSTYVDGKEYLWRVFDEYDQTEFDGIQIKAVCSDQTHFINMDWNKMKIIGKLFLL